MVYALVMEHACAMVISILHHFVLHADLDTLVSVVAHPFVIRQLQQTITFAQGMEFVHLPTHANATTVIVEECAKYFHALV